MIAGIAQSRCCASLSTFHTLAPHKRFLFLSVWSTLNRSALSSYSRSFSGISFQIRRRHFSPKKEITPPRACKEADHSSITGIWIAYWHCDYVLGSPFKVTFVLFASVNGRLVGSDGLFCRCRLPDLDFDWDQSRGGKSFRLHQFTAIHLSSGAIACSDHRLARPGLFKILIQ